MPIKTKNHAVAGLPHDKSVEDPALLISVAWSRRWQSRHLSIEFAEKAKSVVSEKSGKKACIHRARANATLAWQAKWRGDFDEALRLALEAEKHLPEADYPYERAELYSVMGVVHYSRQRLDLADGAVKRGLELVLTDEEPCTYADLLTTSATIHVHVGDMRSAGEAFGKARKAATGEMLARVEHNVARWMLSDDAPKHALEHAQTALALCKTHQNNVVLPYAHEIMGACLVELGEFEAAKRHFLDGINLAAEDCDSRAQCQIIGWYAGLEYKQDSLERSRDLYRFGSEIAKRMNYTLWEKKFARRLADVYEGLGDLPNAVECHKRAWKLEEEKRL